MPVSTSGRNVFTGHSLVKNTSLNLAGQLIPVLVAFGSIPALIHRLGTEKFGVLMLAWMCLGYFNLFDLGLGRALTKGIAERMGTDAESEVPELFWTTLISTAAFGVLGALTMMLSADTLVTSVLKVPLVLEPETKRALIIIAVCVPFVITTTAFKGVLEATQNFLLINKIQVPIGALFYLLPLLFSLYSTELTFVISALVICRLLAWAFFLRAARRALPHSTQTFRFRPGVLPDLLKFGGWITVSNMIIPVISYADRFIIGILISMTAVTYYSTPYEVVNRMWILPWAMMSVVFPAFASQLSTDRRKAAVTYFRAVKLLFVILLPVTVLVLLFAYEGLFLWAGSDLAVNSSLILKILAIGIFVNCFGVIPSAMLDALGRPIIPAISHLIQLPLYVASLYVFIPKYGLIGAAVIWVVRNSIDSLTLYYFAQREFALTAVRFDRLAKISIPTVVLLAGAYYLGGDVWLRLVLYLFFLVGYGYWVWAKFLDKNESSRLLDFIFSRFKPRARVQNSVGPRNRLGIAMAVYKPDVDIFAKQLKSIQDQTFRNWTCVISMDSELNLARPELAVFQTDQRFLWKRHHGPAGVKENFENALNEVLRLDVDMVAFSDQDDVWYPTKLERLVEELRTCPDPSLVHSDMHLFHSDHELAQSSTLPRAWQQELRIVDGYVPLHFFVRNTVSGAGCLFDVSLAKIGSKIPDAVDFHDHWFALLASIIGEIKPIHEPLYAYRQHSRNVVGFAKYEGFFYRPANIGFIEGFFKAAKGWRRMVGLYQALLELGMEQYLPPSYRRLFKSYKGGALFFLMTSILILKNDPVLARAYFRKGVGGLVSQSE